MSTLQEVELAVRKFSNSELTNFRNWFDEFDSSNWDNQIQEDVLNGKLENLAQTAVNEHLNKSSKPL